MSTNPETTIRTINKVLKPWQGCQAQFWSYTASLASLEIRLFSDERPGNVHVACSPCVSIAGPVYWERCELVVESDSGDDGLFIVRDAVAEVRIVCRQLFTFENVEPLFTPRGQLSAEVGVP